MTDSDSPYGRPETSIPRAATSVQMRYFTSPLYTDKDHRQVPPLLFSTNLRTF